MILAVLMAQPEGGAQGGGYLSFLPFILIFLVFYLFLIRPQAKRQKKKQLMLQSLKKGDKVLTVGGLLGTIEGIKDKEDVLIVRIADNVKVKVTRSAIANMVEAKG